MIGEALRANPYVGLRPFLGEDSLYFYGRERQIAELLDILRGQRFLGVVGSSGSGKSSVVLAGLVPALLAGFLVQDRDGWRMAAIRPGDAPIANLAAGLAAATGDAAPDAAAALERDVRDRHMAAVRDFLAPRLPANANLLLLVDQFEEIFAFRAGGHGSDASARVETAHRRAEAAEFVDLLLALAAETGLPIYVALTMRTDFLGDCDLFYGLPEALNRGRYLVPQLGRAELANAIECPALLLGARMAPRLLDALLNELGDRSDRLPVLQHALLRTFDAWAGAGRLGQIDLEHLAAAGGLETALDRDAERALAGLDAALVARVFKRLTDTDPSQRRVRSPARMSALVAAAGAAPDAIDAVVRRFEADGRSFLHRAADGDGADPRVDISHEALIRRWARLSAWVGEEQRARDDYRDLVRRARKWRQGDAALLQGAELSALADWQARAAPSPGWAARYAVAADDYAVATAYADASAAARAGTLAEAELRHGWRQPWLPLLLLAETLLGLRVGFVLTLAFLAETGDFLMGGPAGQEVWLALLKLREVLTSPEFVGFLAYLGGCLLLARAAKRLHRRLALPRIRARLAALGWNVEQAAAEEDALVVQGTGYAPTWRRVAGYLLDLSFLLLAVLVCVLAIVTGVVDLSSLDLLFIGTIGLGVAFSWAYTVFQLASRRQATWGMRVAGIFRTDLHGARLSIARASALYGFRLLSYLFYGIGFWIQPFTAKRQTFHDLMANSVVLRGTPRADAAPAPGS